MIRFSKSKLNTFISCPEKYRLGYELGIRSGKASKTLVEGSCIHHLVESGLVFSQDIEDVLDHASRSFWAEHPFDRCAYQDETEYMAAQAVCLLQSQDFIEQLGPLQVRNIELKVESPLIDPITLEEDPSVSLIGYIDLVLNDSDGNPYLIDLKTVARSPREGMARIALELSMYAYLHTAPFDEPRFTTIPVGLIYLIRTKQPKVHWDESRRSLQHFVELHSICKKIAEYIEHQHFWRNPGMHCSYCDYSSLCYGENAIAVELFGEEGLERYHADQANRIETLFTDVMAVNF